VLGVAVRGFEGSESLVPARQHDLLVA